MPYVASFALLDGKATPVSHTFLRVPSLQPNVVAYRDGLTTVPVAGRMAFTGSFRPSAPGNDGAKRTWTANFPKYDAVTKKVIASGRIKIEILQPDLLEAADLADMQAWLTNFTNAADIKTEVKDQNPVS